MTMPSDIRADKEGKGFVENAYRTERYYGNFSRTIPLPVESKLRMPGLNTGRDSFRNSAKVGAFRVKEEIDIQ